MILYVFLNNTVFLICDNYCISKILICILYQNFDRFSLRKKFYQKQVFFAVVGKKF